MAAQNDGSRSAQLPGYPSLLALGLVPIAERADGAHHGPPPPAHRRGRVSAPLSMMLKPDFRRKCGLAHVNNGSTLGDPL